MKTAVEKLNPTLAKIEVEVPFVEFKPYLDRTYKNLAGQISVPGFRKGKLPKQLIEQRAGFDYIPERRPERLLRTGAGRERPLPPGTARAGRSVPAHY